MSPLIDPIAIDGLPHLFRTGGVHSPFCLVKFDACRLELETAEFKDPAYVALQVLDHVLVLNAQDPTVLQVMNLVV